METAGSHHLLCGDPSSFSQCLLTVDVDRIDADEPGPHETHTQMFVREIIKHEF